MNKIEEFYDPKNLEFSDLWLELEKYVIQLKNSGGFFHEITKEPSLTIKEWEKDLYLSHKFDARINFLYCHNVPVPPYHRFWLDYSSTNYSHILISYEYYFKYKVDLVLDKKECFKYIYKYIKSMILWNIATKELGEWKSKYRNIPRFIKFFSRHYHFEKSQASFDIVFNQQKIKTELEIYLESNMSMDQKLEYLTAWRLFWGNTPEDSRGRRIQI